MNALTKSSLSVRLTAIPEENGWKRKLILSVRVLLVSIHRFMKDDCLIIGSSLAYTTIVTLIPTLTVALALITVASGIQTRQGEMVDDINAYLLRNNIQFDITPYLETLTDIISTASQIGAVGFVVFIFSATAVLRSLEKAFHIIWKIDLHRNVINKFVFYFFLISFGPLLFVVGKNITDKISDSVRPPHLKSIVSTKQGELWVAGEKGNIGTIKELNKSISFIPNSSIDFENMLCVDFDTVETGTCKKPDITKENFFRIRSVGNDLFTISEDGTFLYSNDLGKTWKLHSLKGIAVSDFGAIDFDTIFILTKDTRTLRYEIGKTLKEIKRFTDPGITPIRVRFFTEKDGFILDREGRLWKTSDGGSTFFPQEISPKPLNDIAFLNRNVGFLVGDNGAIFKTIDGGYTWNDLSHRKYSYERVWVFTSPKKQDYDIFILTSLGDILLSEDEGENWTTAYKGKEGMILDMILLSKKTKEIESVLESSALTQEESIEIESQNEAKTLNEGMLGIVGVGEFNKIIRVEEDDKGQTIWKKYQGGKRFFSLYSIFQILLPLLALWLFFLLIFNIIPNTKVPIKASSIGAAVTGVILIIFFWGFINIYLTSFTEKTMLVYKALAAIPIALLAIYSISLIILYGAEVTATLQFPDRYLLPKHPFEDIDSNLSYEFYKTIQVLALTYDHQLKNGELIKLSNLRKTLLMPEKELNDILEKLNGAKLLEITEDKRIAPVKLKEQIDLVTLYEETSSFKLGAPKELNKISPKLNESLSKLELKLKEELQKISFKDLV
ncbi:YihY/virulence factor BrkB family protein [Leptospira sp. 2 VSF19]|uniref:YihY/virulence factor BrkB family protein n=1 Tax=Leptospira soteropolitanensis TaxID=2950025 RepID=A0AAW5VBM5_9LEPT|nr:YhjD/YihY/BrkB family envelope integrity protein [Leptospira soteropolitanensis]MCW7492349.1 YihY/virulence factor BrkB family protein [Leptospira soteropolitanensis]MCW7499931.1 YihY/virulence factor BrkB family protein [Leptospira soteropolitanensis]MCW7522182.1 YihY/virulence factor BrkB family protein [Leptospira soteropolitanensis]MCW7526036.1 YihY/virulence factor BrkB family protein [Leptospira soteropolitanensis]MCW7529850.1 YihY/virulence factor BrkB family protein [Leptospira sote